MNEAGIDTKTYKPHSIRSVSSTKAVQVGNSIQDVKTYANWSQNSNTLEKYYNNPTSQASSSTTIANSIFSTENSITLEIGVESTGIVLRTTKNSTVDGTKTVDVILACPWHRSLFR